MEKFIMANNTAVRYADYGKGEQVVVLIHGYLETMDVWDDLGGELGKKYRVITIDLPGHGISEVVGEMHSMEFLADTLQDCLKKANVEKCCLVGHSMGGYVALEFAAKYASMLNGLVLLSSTPNVDTPEKITNRQREIELVMAGKKEALARVNPARGFAPQNVKRFADTIEWLQEIVLMTDDEGIVAILRGMMERRDHNQTLTQLKVPKLLIFGVYDQIIVKEVGEQVVAQNPDAQVLWLQNSGHMGYIEEPQIVSETLDRFLSTLVK